MEEIWKDIEGFEGLYQISNMGRVKSVERMKWSGKCYYKAPEKILKAGKSSGGYLFVWLCKDGKGKWCVIHRLVAKAFLPNPEELPEVNHIDEDKTNNCVTNLEWCSKKYNINYGTRRRRALEKINKPVISISKISGLIMEYPSAAEAERMTGVYSTHITRCCKGKQKSSGGFYWMYANADTTE